MTSSLSSPSPSLFDQRGFYSRFRQQSDTDVDRAQDKASVSASLAETCVVLPTGQADHFLMRIPEPHPLQIDLSVHISTKSTVSLPS